MSDRACVVVPLEFDGVRIDRTLAVLAELSRSQAQTMIAAGDVLLNSAPATKATTPHEGDTIEYPVPPVEGPLVPEPVEFDVATEEPDVIVVNKPVGLVVHPGAGNQTGTLAHGLAYRYPELDRLGSDHRWGLVHRLDRDTSGLLLVARTAEMHEFLQRELKQRNIARTYLALVSGELPAVTGTIDAPIGRDPLRPTRMAIVTDGRPARTHYRRLAGWDDCGLLEIELETGRTHQIRVHLSSIGHGIVGDPLYGDATGGSGNPGRVWLHAARLRFPMPDGTERSVEAALPADLVASLETLGEPASGEV